MSGFLDKTGLTHLWEKMKAALAGKQDKLTAGNGIQIVNGVISVSLDNAEETDIAMEEEEATIDDYKEALVEMGVDLNEEE